MRRNSFEAESRIVGQDFGQLIEQEGGKSAGLHLLTKGIPYLRAKGKLRTRDVPCPIGTVKWYPVPTRAYRQLEPILGELISRLDGTKDERLRIRELLYHQEIAKVMREATGQVAKAFPGYHEDSFRQPIQHIPRFHVRTSTTLCDFRDDRYFGTFLTKGDEPFFQEFEDEFSGEVFSQGAKLILELMLDFYAKKHFGKDIYGIDDNEKIGCVVMPTTGKYDLDVIAYSSYPEVRASPALLETWVRKSLQGHAALELVRAKSLKEMERIRMSLKRNADRDEPLTDHEAETIYMLAKAFEEELDYSVNLELTVLGERKGVIPLQLRPVPTLSEEREVRELAAVPENMQVVAETPFVFGSYRKTARVVRPDYKNDYLKHSFREPVIMWHTDDFKGHRFYESDENCIAVLNPEEGAVLTHDSNLIPSFGKARDSFAFIGLPIKGFRGKLEACLQAREEETHRGKDKIFRYTPFELTLESDGRKGRVLVDKINAHYFQN